MPQQEPWSEEVIARIVRIDEGKRECLRLSFQHFSSKEISRRLGISKDTVDQRIDRARKILGVGTRIEAARILVAYEATLYDCVVYDPMDIAPAAATAAPSFSSNYNVATGVLDGVAEPQAPYHPVQTPGAWDSIFPRGNPNDLTLSKRLEWVAKLALMLAVLVFVLLAIGQTATNFVSDRPDQETITATQ